MILDALNYTGVFAFAISGALAGIRNKADIFGILVLSFCTACCGGIVRDVLIGSIPPDNIVSIYPLLVSLLAGLLTSLFPALLHKLNNPVQFFDAIGLGLFTVVGIEKSLAFGINPVWALLLGTITAIGGGMVRDVFLARIPVVLTAEVYAVASLAGGGVMILTYNQENASFAMFAGSVSCIVLRLVSLKYKLKIPTVSE